MISSYIRIGHLPTDTDRERQFKSVFALLIMAFGLLSLEFIFLRERSYLQLVVDSLLFVTSILTLFVLQVSKRCDRAYIFTMIVGLPATGFFLLLDGNREGDLIFLVLIPICAILVLGPRRSIPWFVASVAVVLLVAGVGFVHAADNRELASIGFQP